MNHDNKVMSKAERRRLQKPQVIITTEMREKQREELRALRKAMRFIKSHGARGKMNATQKEAAKKRNREELDAAMECAAPPRVRGRRLEREEGKHQKVAKNGSQRSIDDGGVGEKRSAS